MLGRIRGLRTLARTVSCISGAVCMVGASVAAAQTTPIRHTVTSDGHPLAL